MRNEIVVQEGEIAIAQRGVSTSCAIAAAIMTQIPTARRIKVARDEISWLDLRWNERLIFRTPDSAKVFIENWDLGNPCQPFTFALTDNSLLARRAPRTKSTRARVGDSGRPIKPTQNPGILRRRGPQGGAC